MMPRRWSRRYIHLTRASIGFFLTFFFTPVILSAPKELMKGRSEGQAFVVEQLAQISGLMWSFDFLPDGTIVMTERSGKLMLFDPKTEKVTPVAGAPEVWEKGQGGLLEVRVHPGYAKTKWIYLTYSEPAQEGGARTALGRGKLEGAKLVGFERLFRAEPATKEAIHFGSRIEFDGKGGLFMTSGERNE
ncbi:MAG: PQQ-dependent sugar dehydrogenase, partial [Bdellovibrionota bacterium]